ncbi:hypothetical protein M5689_020772 [Euphorbia peplus]|nr:hypothetical protein M5689_020772 [Euphorbia peplus]
MIRPKSPEKVGGKASCQSASSKPRKEKHSGKMIMVEEQPEKTKSDSEKLYEEIEDALRCAEGEVKRAEEVFQADLNIKQPEENFEEDPEEEQEEEQAPDTEEELEDDAEAGKKVETLAKTPKK